MLFCERYTDFRSKEDVYPNLNHFMTLDVIHGEQTCTVHENVKESKRFSYILYILTAGLSLCLSLPLSPSLCNPSSYILKRVFPLMHVIPLLRFE